MRASPHSMPSLLAELVVADEQASTLPLEHVEVNGQIVGLLASIALTQRFANPFSEPIELMYRFPIPHRASLAGFAIQIGGRTIEGEVDRREDAETLFREAVDAGQRAALATEERPNLYTVRIGNVQPGEAIVASYRYSMSIELDGGEFEVVLPFGTTSRYHRPDEPPEEAAATDVAIAPPGALLPALDVTLAIDAGVAIRPPRSPSHQIEVTCLDERRCVVKLVSPRIPNKDFVVRYAVQQSDGAMLTTAWRTSSKAGDLVYAVFVPPPPEQVSVAARPREFVFVLDRSGSMSGNPIAQARNALRACLRTLTLDDTFRILVFDNQVDWYEPSRERAVSFDDDALRSADAFLGSVEGRGGTELGAALRVAIASLRDPSRQRVLVVLTDGAISAEEETTKLVEGLPRGDRLFCFGIGPAVNRYLLDRLARAGRGVAEVVGLDEDIEGTIIRFQDRLSFPILTDLELRVIGGSLAHMYPSVLPDLFAGQALQVVVQLGGPVAGPVLELRGSRADETVVLRVEIPTTVDEPMIRRLWAQKRIDALLESPFAQGARNMIVALSLEHHILTQYTALVAIDQEAVAMNQRPRKVVVSTPLPEGLDYSGFVAHHIWWPENQRAYGRDLAAPYTPPQGKVLYLRKPTAEDGASERRLQALFASDSDALTAASHVPEEMTAENALRKLIRQQSARGAWEAGDQSVELTAAAIVAFARAGHTANRGTFRRALRRALGWLESHARTPLEHWLLRWARAEVAAADADHQGLARLIAEIDALPDDGGSVISRAIARRIRQLAGNDEAEVLSDADLDPRIVVISGDKVPGDVASNLSLHWKVCLTTSRSR
jgi:Ca-activated chloride channel family protein